MQCPICKYPVPAEWSMCRRCGAPLHAEPEDRRIAIPSTMSARRKVGHGASVTTAARSTPAAAPPSGSATASAFAAALRAAPPDTLLPGAMPRPDNLLPRATRAKSTPARRPAAIPTHGPASDRPGASGRVLAAARTHWRHALVLAIVAAALTASVVAVWPVVFRTNAPSAASSAAADAHAAALLRTVVGGGRTIFATHHSYAGATAADLSARSYHVPIVAATTSASAGAVSMNVTSPGALTLATPAGSNSCVFARDEPARGGTEWVTVATGDCRAAAAPAQGWSSA